MYKNWPPKAEFAVRTKKQTQDCTKGNLVETERQKYVLGGSKPGGTLNLKAEGRVYVLS